MTPGADWERRHAEAPDLGAPAAVLTENLHLAPRQGRVLDLACGRGANALVLAERGLEVHAWDRSETALERLQQAAAGWRIRTQCRDVIEQPPAAEAFDLILVAHFLHRPLFPALRAALRPGGLLFYQTFDQHRLTGRGPSNPEFRLRDNELLTLCQGLAIRHYREEAAVGDTAAGRRDLAMIIAQRPPTEPG